MYLLLTLKGAWDDDFIHMLSRCFFMGNHHRKACEFSVVRHMRFLTTREGLAGLDERPTQKTRQKTSIKVACWYYYVDDMNVWDETCLPPFCCLGICESFLRRNKDPYHAGFFRPCFPCQIQALRPQAVRVEVSGAQHEWSSSSICSRADLVLKFGQHPKPLENGGRSDG